MGAPRLRLAGESEREGSSGSVGSGLTLGEAVDSDREADLRGEARVGAILYATLAVEKGEVEGTGKVAIRLREVVRAETPSRWAPAEAAAKARD